MKKIVTLAELVEFILQTFGDKIFVIMCGLPGSGKTRVARALKKLDYWCITLEAAAEIQVAAASATGNQAWLKPAVTWELIRQAVTVAVDKSVKLIVVDTPNILRSTRDELTDIANGYVVVRIHMKTDWRLCRERIVIRDQDSPYHLLPDPEQIEEMHGVLSSPENMPRPSEGNWLILEQIPDAPHAYELSMM